MSKKAIVLTVAVVSVGAAVVLASGERREAAKGRPADCNARDYDSWRDCALDARTRELEAARRAA